MRSPGSRRHPPGMPSTDDRSSLAQEVHELERIAETGGSSKMPLILLGGVWVISVGVAVVMIALALLAYRLAR
jgi:hypothetical protein